MANYDWTISHSSNQGGSWTDITSLVQSWNYRYGRQNVTDQWAAGSGFVQGWDPASLPTISVGDWLKFDETTHTTQYVLTVADFVRIYNPAPTADTWQIRLEDAYAQAGRARAEYAASTAGGEDVGTVLLLGTFVANIAAVINYGYISTCPVISVAKGDSLTGLIQQLNNQVGAYIQANDASSGIQWYGVDAMPWWGDPLNDFSVTNFDDDNTLTNGEPYTEIQFEGLADAYFDKIYVAANGLAIQDAGTGTRTYETQTRHQTTAQAYSWANYLLQQLGSTTPTPGTLSTTTLSWSTTANIAPFHLLPGNEITLRLRGTNYYGIIEGGIVSATPAQTRFTLYLSDREAVNFLLLDDPVWGKLDSNRLGF
jgi:hypothetical protein